jgi:Polyketide cyclase / dehydrase and lipid transport
VRGSARATGPVPPAQVWERYAVPERWPDWAPQIARVQASAPRIGPGVTGRVWGPLGVRIRFVVTEVDERLRTWAWSVRLGRLRLRLEHGVDADPAGSATWLRVHGPAPVVAAYLPVARLALHRLVHAPS